VVKTMETGTLKDYVMDIINT